MSGRGRFISTRKLASLISNYDFKLFVGIEKLCRLHFKGAGKLQDIVETDVLLSTLHVTHKVPVRLDHLAQLLLGNAALRAQGTEAFAEG